MGPNLIKRVLAVQPVEFMPLCPKCGEYYVKKCEACGFSMAAALEQVSHDTSAASFREDDARERRLSLERRRIYDFLSKTSEKVTIRQIATEVQVSQSTVKKALTELIAEGYLLSDESTSGVPLYRLTESGHSRFRYSSETLGDWSPPSDKERLYDVLTTISAPITVKEICKRSSASEYLVRKTIKLLEQHGEAICEDRDARPRKYAIKAGQFTESLLES